MFILGLLMLIEFFFNIPTVLKGAVGDIQNFAVIIAAFALGIGALTLLFNHGRLISKREPGQWYYSLWLLIVMVVFVVLGVSGGTDSPSYQWIFENLFMPVDMTLYSLIGWLVIYAIYLTFRARNFETLFMLVVAFFTLMGNAPIGSVMWGPFADIKSWLAAVPNTAAVRGFYIAMALGAIAVGIRTLIGKERGALGG